MKTELKKCVPEIEIRFEPGDFLSSSLKECGIENNTTLLLQMTDRKALMLARSIDDLIGALDRPKTEADRNTIQHLRERIKSLLIQNVALQQELLISTDRVVILEQQLAKQQEENLALQKELTTGAVRSNIRREMI
jgi:hypothetical protein